MYPVRRTSVLAVWAIFGTTVVACSDHAAKPAPMDTTTTGTGGSTAAPMLIFDPLTLDEGDRQALAPGEVRQFGVIASPPDVYRVRFSIIPGVQEPPHDASLDRTDTNTDEAGKASVTLRGPSIPTSFTLQASIAPSGATDSIEVVVQSRGVAEIQVLPQYDGERRITEWVASAHVQGSLCSELARTTVLDRGLPADSSYRASSVFGIPPRIKDVPVVPLMAVTVRAGHFVYGCANADQPVANELSTIRVIATNVPISLVGVNVDANLGISETDVAWLEHLQTAADAVLSAFADDTENDLELLLNMMADELDDDRQQAFSEARLAGGWELKAVPSLASMDGLLLRHKLVSWLSEGSNSLKGEAAIRAQIQAPDAADMPAKLKLLQVAGVEAERAGFAETLSATWTADADDWVALGVTLNWQPTRLVTALAEAQATTEFPETDTLEQALGELVNCAQLSQALVAEDGELVFADCDASCTEELCVDALSALADRARDASEDERQLQLSATGAGSVDDEARLVGFSGSWRGTFASGETSVVGGIVEGSKTDTE